MTSATTEGPSSGGPDRSQTRASAEAELASPEAELRRMRAQLLEYARVCVRGSFDVPAVDVAWKLRRIAWGCDDTCTADCGHCKGHPLPAVVTCGHRAQPIEGFYLAPCHLPMGHDAEEPHIHQATRAGLGYQRIGPGR